MSEHIDVFVSSTSRDLGPYRARLDNVIRSLGMFPIMMEDFNPSDRNAVQKSYDEVQKAEIFVGVYAHRYGYCPKPDVTYSGGAPDGKTSITHMEYQWALARKIPLRLFVVDEKHPWPSTDIEGGRNKARLKKFLDRVKTDHVVKFFTDPGDLALKVSVALGDLARQKGVTLAPEGWRVLQAPPPPPNFVGRADDIAKICDLLKPDGAKVVIQGPGGTGKTALARHLGRALASEYPGGVLWAFLGPAATGVESTCAAVWENWKQVTAQGRNTEIKDVTATHIKRWLNEAPAPLLVIIDDIWHDAPLRALLDSIPESAAVLSTTRDAAHITPRVGRRYELHHLTPDDARAMLSRRLDPDGKHAADLAELAKLLGYHALALDLAAARLENSALADLPRRCYALLKKKEAQERLNKRVREPGK
jgi:energy-coupling factor transporter ATP-binding protein EcfA2